MTIQLSQSLSKHWTVICYRRTVYTQNSHE